MDFLCEISSFKTPSKYDCQKNVKIWLFNLKHFKKLVFSSSKLKTEKNFKNLFLILIRLCRTGGRSPGWSRKSHGPDGTSRRWLWSQTSSTASKDVQWVPAGWPRSGTWRRPTPCRPRCCSSSRPEPEANKKILA